MRRFTKTISILLALLMVLGAFPTFMGTAAAEEAEGPTTGSRTEEMPEAADAEEPAPLPDEPEQPTALPQGLRSISTAASDADFDGIPDAIDSAPNSNVFTGAYQSGDFQIDLSYTMDYRTFFGNNMIYHEDIAGTSVWAAQFCYEVAEKESDQVTYTPLVVLPDGEGGTYSKITHVDQFMKAHGMENVIDYKLNEGCAELGISAYGDDDITEVFLGHHRVEYNGQAIEVLAVFVRGTNKTTEEWCSNFDVGDLNRYGEEYDTAKTDSPIRQSNADWNRKSNHRGFDVCATRIRRAIAAYRQTYLASSDAEPVYWLTGHSRGAAVANLLASYYVDEGSKVFAYTFASPNNTANTEATAAKYDCIYNLVNADDFVPMLPMPEWGFTRYGRTARTSAPAKNSTDRSSILGTGGYSCATQDELNELANKFVAMTVDNQGVNLGWRDVYVYHCRQDSGSTAQYHNHTGETIGEYRDGSWKSFFTNSNWNNYDEHLKKYSYCVRDGNGWVNKWSCCQTPAYAMQTLATTMGGLDGLWNSIGSGWTFLTGDKLADRYDYGKTSLLTKAMNIIDPHYMENYYLIQTVMERDNADMDALFTKAPVAHEHSYVLVPYTGQEPTCTETGLGYMICECSQINSAWYDDIIKDVVIPATGHDWDEPTYEWAADNSTCTATRICERNSVHVETETVNTVSEETTPATYTAEGEMTYTATFANEAFAEQTKTETIPKLTPEYWLIGPDWNLAAIDPANGFVPNPANANEYMLETTLAVGDKIKVVRVVNNAITNWYPEGTDNEYTVDAAHAGNTTVYFKTTYDSAWSAFGGYIWIAERTPEFKNHQLFLSDRIGVRFFVDLSMLSETDRANANVTFAITGKGASEMSADPVALDPYKTNGSGYYGFDCLVNSIQMADTITATLHYGNNQTVTDSYSVRTYVQVWEELYPTDTSKVTTLLHALADFGHYVQPYLATINGFTVGTDYAAMDQFYAQSYDVEAIKTAAAAYRKTVGGSDAFKAPSTSLVLDSKTAIRVFLAHADNMKLDLNNVQITVTPQAGIAWPTDQWTATQSGNRILVEIRDVKASWLDKNFTVTVTEGTDSQTVTLSALSYVEPFLNTYSGNTAAQNAICAFYQYAMASISY